MNTNIVEKLFNKSRKVNFPDFTRDNGQLQANGQDQHYYVYNDLYPMAETASSVPTTVSFYFSQLSDDDDNDSFLLDFPKETSVEDTRPKRVYSITNRTPSPIPISRNNQDPDIGTLNCSLYSNNSVSEIEPNQENDTATFDFTDFNMYFSKSEPVASIKGIRRKPTPYSNKVFSSSDEEEQDVQMVNLEAILPEISNEEEQTNDQEPAELTKDKIKIKELKKLLSIQSKQLEYYQKRMKEELSRQLLNDADEVYVRDSYNAYNKQISQQENNEKALPNASRNNQYHDYFHHANYYYPYSRNHYYVHRHSAPAISSSVPIYSDNYLYYHYYQHHRHYYMHQQQQQNRHDYMNFYHHYDHEYNLDQPYTR